MRIAANTCHKKACLHRGVIIAAAIVAVKDDRGLSDMMSRVLLCTDDLVQCCEVRGLALDAGGVSSEWHAFMHIKACQQTSLTGKIVSSCTAPCWVGSCPGIAVEKRRR